MPPVPPAEQPQRPSANEHDFPVAAIGASAGGLEAFTELLRHLPANTGMAFVFIQHLAPGHESMLAQLLARETAMPVQQAANGTRLAPDHVYVIPPNTAMTLSDSALALTPRGMAGTAVDVFLRSLAVECKSRAVAVILSGTGSDGALGVQAIAEEGGVVLAQEPGSAKFDSMPRSAIGTGCVDAVLAPEQIGAELARIAREPYLLPQNAQEEDLPFPEQEFRSVIGALREATGIDFGAYRQTTVRRRMLRRAALLRHKNLDAYAQHVRTNPEEVHALAQDILIGVTRFFRDPEVFDALSRRVFPHLIRKTPPDRCVRIWAAGCSTGEEAYSLAICFMETAERMRSRVTVQVFATDINEAAIEKARRGVYLENITADVSAERLARFFVRTGGEYQVSRRLRDLCVFSRHDLLYDAAFSRMGLVSCRNLLIYLESMQEEALNRFHFALNPGGFLLLGKSERVSSAELFAPVDKGVGLYVRQEAARHIQRAERRREANPPSRPNPPGSRVPRGIDLRRQADRLLVERYSPPWVIVNRALETAGPGNESAPFLASASGIQDRSLPDFLGKDGEEAVRRAVQNCAQTGLPARVPERGIDVTPLEPDRQHFLLVFGRREPEVQHTDASLAQIEQLNKELAASRAHLEAVIVEQETASEELVAFNEELQSLNEELESSKEEIEASNEELTTVNQELQVRNTELENAIDFAQGTIDTVRGALLVLGPDLRVLRANTSFYRMFQTSAAEVDHRFIYELGETRWSLARLRELLEEILPQSRSLEDFEMEHDAPGVGRRILLMNAHRFERQDRILLAIEDVTESRRLQDQLAEARKMEAIGYLSAGIAHDFNNLLTGIMGNADLVLESLPEDDSRRETLQSVLTGAERAANLTRQLLAYAGKGRFYLQRVDLSDLVAKTGRLVHSSIPANVQMEFDLEENLPMLLADAGQMQQIVMNLVINAAESIGERHGTVRVRTARERVTGEPLPDLASTDKPAPGDYVCLEVEDNGAGMDRHTMRRIFDPFFTTKFTGRGLGLAAVLGIARQQKGAVQVRSVLGRGTSFRVLLPVGETGQLLADESAEDLRGSGTVLVIDDEEMIRIYTRAALTRQGYTPLMAESGEEGIRLFRERSAEVGLVLLDVFMPGMSGPATMDGLRAIRPDVPVLLMSGFGDLDVEKQFGGRDIAGFLPKPFTLRQVGSAVKQHMRGMGEGAQGTG